MRLIEMNWMQLEEYLKHDDRCVLPLGSTEQHAYMSLGVDSILAEKVSLDAAEPLAIPVYPVLSYGISPHWSAYKGTVTLRLETYINLIRDILDSMATTGFKRILIVNGHGGNQPAAGMAREWSADNPIVKVKFHNWWNAPKTWAKTTEIDPEGSHASWAENFPWTRLEGVPMPNTKKPVVDMQRINILSPQEIKAYIGDGNMGGLYQRSDSEALALWEVGVEETRKMLTHGWE